MRYLQRLITRVPGRADVRSLTPPDRMRSAVDESGQTNPFENVEPPPRDPSPWPVSGADWPTDHASEPRNESAARRGETAEAEATPTIIRPAPETLLAPVPGEQVMQAPEQRSTASTGPQTMVGLPSRPSRLEMTNPSQSDRQEAVSRVVNTTPAPVRMIAGPDEQEPWSQSLPEALPQRPASLLAHSHPHQTSDVLLRDTNDVVPPRSPALDGVIRLIPQKSTEASQPLPLSTAMEEQHERENIRATPYLRPPLAAPLPSPLADDPQQPRVVIGRLRVEVVSVPPAVQAAPKWTPPPKVSTSNSAPSPHSMLRFGLGQL